VYAPASQRVVVGSTAPRGRAAVARLAAKIGPQMENAYPGGVITVS
jgi:hypothetical protein